MKNLVEESVAKIKETYPIPGCSPFLVSNTKDYQNYTLIFSSDIPISEEILRLTFPNRNSGIYKIKSTMFWIDEPELSESEFTEKLNSLITGVWWKGVVQDISEIKSNIDERTLRMD